MSQQPLPEAAPESPPPPTDPPSLRRRAPARLDITLHSGQCPEMSRRRIHIRAGRTLVVQVVPPHSGAKVEIVAESPLAVVMPVSRIEAGGPPSYHGEYTGRSALRVVPLPVTGRLHISVSDGHPNPVRVTIPVTVWPSLGTLAFWWVVAILGILGIRWRESLAKSDSPLAIVPKVQSDWAYVLELLLLGVVVMIPLRIIGWLMTLGNPGDGSS